MTSGTIWVSLSLLHYVRILARHRRRDYLLFAFTAALAVGTKDQASALYVLLPLIIPLADYVRRRGAGEHAPLWRSFVNANTLCVLLVGAATLALIHNLAFNWTGAIERLRIMTGPITTSLQEFPNMVAGHAAMLWLGLRHLQFSLGWPLFVAAVAGVLLTLLRWRSHPRAIALLAPVLSYWIFLIVPLMYHYDRYLMPVALILSVFAGHAAAAFTRPGALAIVRTTVAAAAIAFTVAHAASVDALLVSDGRYAAERWIQDHIPAGEHVMAIGYDLYLPRLDGLDVITNVEPVLEDVSPESPPYLITTSIFDEWRFRDSPRSLAFFQALTSGKTIYQLVYVGRGRPRFNLLDLDGVRTNLDKINPEIRIYRRAGSVVSQMRPLARPHAVRSRAGATTIWIRRRGAAPSARRTGHTPARRRSRAARMPAPPAPVRRA
jgi:hypothetical protein